MTWDSIESSGTGKVVSFTTLHHPKFPGYDYPIIVVLVELAEGTRLTAQLLECERENVEFGMPVQAFMHKDEDGFQLPMFRPAKPSPEQQEIR